MRRALGKGLTQLLGEQMDSSVLQLPIGDIVPNSRQPRTQFDEDDLAGLAESIRLSGVLQPLLVRPISDGKYELIAGERRLRASKLAGLGVVPVLVKSAENREALELALVENIQREDLSAFETATAFRMLIVDYHMTQEEVALRVGKSRSAVANTVRLLKLPRAILDALQQDEVSEAVVRPLLSLESEAEQLALFRMIVAKGMNARDVEEAVRQRLDSRPVVRERRTRAFDPNWNALCDRISERIGSRVKLEGSGNRGRLVIPFENEDDFIRIIEALGLEE